MYFKLSYPCANTESFSYSNIIMVFILIFLWHLNLFSVHLFNVLKLCTYYAPHTFLTIPDLSNLSLLSFSSDHSSKRLVSFIDLFKATTFYFNDFFSIIFLFFILLIFTLIFIISFFLLALGLVDSFFFPQSVLIWKVRLLTCDLSSLIIQTFTAINFALRTPLAASHKFNMLF